MPGLSFDVNPANRRSLSSSPCARFVRLSFGPKMEKLKLGLDGIARVIERSKDPAGLEAMNKDVRRVPLSLVLMRASSSRRRIPTRSRAATASRRHKIHDRDCACTIRPSIYTRMRIRTGSRGWRPS